MPKQILVEDQDGGYILAVVINGKDGIGELTDRGGIPIYRYKEYYHTLKDVERDLYGKVD